MNACEKADPLAYALGVLFRGDVYPDDAPLVAAALAAELLAP